MSDPSYTKRDAPKMSHDSMGEVDSRPPVAPGSNGMLSGRFGVFLVVVLLGSAAALGYKALTTAPAPTPETHEVILMCVETGKSYTYKVKVGDTWPAESPYSHRRTGYPTEKCFWSKDGTIKEEPTYVVLNEWVGKSGDTFCPECGRLVVGHNPPPDIEHPPPAMSAPAEPAK